ncbi:MAG: hypothetical protein AB7E52_04315 [Bdellovibrionales bacterium]
MQAENLVVVEEKGAEAASSMNVVIHGVNADFVFRGGLLGIKFMFLWGLPRFLVDLDVFLS